MPDNEAETKSFADALKMDNIYWITIQLFEFSFCIYSYKIKVSFDIFSFYYSKNKILIFVRFISFTKCGNIESCCLP